jgi:hypothetical protein
MLIAGAALIAFAAGFVALQTEPEPSAPQIMAMEPSVPRMVEIGGEIIPYAYEPGSGLIVIENETEPDAGPIGALVRAN